MAGPEVGRFDASVAEVADQQRTAEAAESGPVPAPGPGRVQRARLTSTWARVTRLRPATLNVGELAAFSETVEPLTVGQLGPWRLAVTKFREHPSAHRPNPSSHGGRFQLHDWGT